MSTPKLLIWCILLIAISASLSAQSSSWTWAKQGGGTGEEVNKAVVADASGNSYITGYYKGNAVFGTTTLTNTTSYYDTYVAKLDPNGNWLWAVKGGGSKDDMANAMAIDPNGSYLYITGNFNSQPATFGSNSISSTDTDTDIFVAKVNTANGQWVWARKAGGSDADIGNAICVDANSNLYVSGGFAGTATFIAGAINLTSAGGKDVLVAKMNSSGTWQWALRAGGTNDDQANAVDVSSSGEAYVAGLFNSPTASFGNISLSNYNGTSSDIFVAKATGTGAWQWASKGGGAGLDSAYALSLDQANNVYITGLKANNVWFGSVSLPGADAFDTFVAKSNSSGEWLWARKATCSSVDFAYAIDADAWNNVHLTGVFQSSISFGSTTLNGSSSSTTDVYLAKIDSGGNWLAAEKTGNTNIDTSYGVYADASGRVYWSGQFSGAITIGTINLSSNNGSQDVFIAKKSSTQIYLVSPRGGESWIAGTSHAVSWTASNVSDVLLDYSLNGGGNWNPITTNPLAASLGSYNWVVPNLTSNNVTVRVRSASDANLASVSPQPFTIYIPLELESLNDGGSYIANTQQNIDWQAVGVAQVSLDFSLDAGSTWTQINPAPITASLGTYSWLLPEVISDESLVRVRDCSQPAICDSSNTMFTIYIPLILDTMNGGENVTYRSDSVQTIEWDAMQVNQVLLDYSLDGGSSWQPIVDTPLPASLEEYSWTLPDLNCYSVKVRISDAANPSICAMSSGTFSICRPLELETLTGGQGINFAANSAQQIVWNACLVDQVILEYSTDSGQTWLPITDTPIAANLHVYEWTLPNITNHNVRIRIAEVAQPFASVMSAADFAIIVPPTAPTEVAVGSSPTNNNDFQISWNAVLTDVNGDPIQPDGYRIYCCEGNPENPQNYILLAEIRNGNTFVHADATQLHGLLFYKVVAFRE